MNKHKIEYDFDRDAFLKVNKGLLRRFGPEVAVFISNLIDKYKYFTDNFTDNLMVNDGWFFLIHSQQIEQTGLTIRKLHRCKRTAILNKWIKTKWIGSPAKEWYKINLELLDTQSAMTKCNSSTIYESGSNDKTSQQAMTKRNGLPLQNAMAHIKETKKGNYEKDNKEEIFKEENPNPLGSEENKTTLFPENIDEKEFWKDMTPSKKLWDKDF